MSLTIRGHFDLSKVTNVDEVLPKAAVAGAGVIKDEAVRRVPKLSGVLASTGHVTDGGSGTAHIRFSSVYAHWIEEGLDFAHPHGGQAKYLQSSLIDKAPDALDKAADVIRAYIQ